MHSAFSVCDLGRGKADWRRRRINPLIHDMVMECAVERDVPLASKTGVISPYAQALMKAGLDPDDDNDDSDDDSDGD